jgi:hypothetical protein
VRWLSSIAVVVTAASAARAEVRARLVVDGGCPDAAAVRAALPAAVAIVDDPPIDLAIAVDSGPTGVVVTLRSGDLQHAQVVAGHDCAALAGAVAALVDAWSIELEVPPRSGSPSNDGGRGEREPVAAPGAVQPPPAPEGSRAAATAVARWYLGVGRAFVFATDTDRSAATRVDAAWRSPRYDLRLRLALDWGDAATLDGGMASRRPIAVTATVGRRWGQRLRGGGELGGGVVVSRVDPTATSARGANRFHPLATAGLVAGVAIGSGVSVRAEVTAAVLPIADRYTIGAMELGHSPWATVAAGLGLDVALGAR